MPIYEYQCASCNHQFELMQKVNDAPATTCPQCFEENVIRMVSAAAFKLKGSGWYETDFKTKKPETATDTGENKPKTEGTSKGDKVAEKPTEKPKTQARED